MTLMGMVGKLDVSAMFKLSLFTIYRQSVSKAVRKLDTIDMDEDVKLDIVRDAEYYYSDES
jgi:hypothetical protein